MEYEAKTALIQPTSYPTIPEATVLLRALNLKLGYGDKVLLHADDLALKQGVVTALIGPNGAGKSTLLRSLAGLTPCLNGSIYLDREELSNISSSSTAKYISLVLTQKGSLGMMTVRELVALGRAPHTPWHGQLNKKDWQEVDQAIQRVNMSSFAYRLVDELSDGERQKVMLARALAQDTPIILLDEPTAHLDLSNRLEIFQLLSSLAQELDKSILISTHELSLAVQLSGELWLISPHKKQLSTGIPEDLVLSGAISNAFPQVHFDWSGSGFMTIPQPKPKYAGVHVSGNHLATKWTKQALARAGYPIEEVGQAYHHIEIEEGDKGYLWFYRSKAFKSLSLLLSYMANH